MTITVTEPNPVARAEEILTPEALAFVESLHERFAGRREELLGQRRIARVSASQAGRLDFLPETASVRQGEWQVAEAPAALRDRRVEMTGPASPIKMAINALNSGAKVWLADLEDANSPTWFNMIDSLLNLRDAARGTLAYTSPEGKEYSLRTDVELPVVVTRPRGWHLAEAHLLLDGHRTVAALVDFGLHIFHIGQLLIDGGRGPYYYLPKLESHLEARLWNDVFTFAEERLGFPAGTIRATVLIETIPAAFQMEEILYELREHASGLNAGRWDYLFSVIKYFRDAGPDFVLVDRADITMTAPFMRAYTELLVQTCHKRGAFAMGGMAAFIPNRRDPEANTLGLTKVRDDKLRESGDGFDGSWVAHPDLVPICREVFDNALGDKSNQLDRQRQEVSVTAEQLLDIPATPGGNTRVGLANNLYVAIAYVGSWIGGNGAVAIHNLMEDAATAEISRAQVWQQIFNGVTLDDTGERVTRELVAQVLAEQTEVIRQEFGAERFAASYKPAADLVAELVLAEDFVDFLTLPAYEKVI